MIKSVVFDIDGTMLDTGQSTLNAFRDTLMQVKPELTELPDLAFTFGIPTDVSLRQLGVDDVERAEQIWMDIYKQRYAPANRPFDGIEEVIKELKVRGYKLGIATSKNRDEYANDFTPLGLGRYFDTVICVEDSEKPKPAPDPLLKYLELSRGKAEETLFIGDTVYDLQCAAGAGVLFGLAVWGGASKRNLRADYYFNTPKDILYSLDIDRNQPSQDPWLKWAVELQFLAQAGLTYSKDPFDLERFQRAREIAAEIMSMKTGQSLEFVNGVFCNETGFQTPKLDTRAAIFEDGKILLVKENDGRWSLPGGWVDATESVKSNTVKEVKEEAGLNVVAVKLIALQDRNLHNKPVYAYGVTKAFVLCDIIDGEFTPNTETTESRYFALDELPPLAEEKNTPQQVRLCFEAYNDKNWATVFD